ncbi:GNAT family N-acetyltransferase [Desulfoluna spongiiphila]|uniref:GNAT family N-acetyltransferase n=1 Tax=Desulfoluna spongiiphila TaxID=419481 RepID=UPI001253A5C2|nr:GNAT family N-acetyltransferase [Desulfoluna spongiiphila]VVS94875.1 acyl-coa n-acyltransferase [Desulfoluna spongiiphila]
MSKDVTIRSMQSKEDDLFLFKNCFEVNGSKRDMDHLRWQYLDNPEGHSFVDFAIGETQPGSQHEVVAGIYAVFPVQFSIGGRNRLGVQSIDTMTDYRFRRQGLFRELAGSVNRRLADEGVQFVYGFPNGSSAYCFFNHLKWQRLDPVPFLVRPLRTGLVLRKLGPAGKILGKFLNLPLPLRRFRRLSHGAVFETVTWFDEEYDRLWAQFSKDIGVSVRRDSSYLNWRICNNPRFSYITIAARLNGELAGFVTYRVVNKHGGRIGYIMDLVYRPELPDIGKVLLSKALRSMRNDGAELVLAWCLEHSLNRSIFKSSFFMPFPESLRPVELHFGVRKVNKPDSDIVSQRSEWYISYLDSDTV